MMNTYYIFIGKWFSIIGGAALAITLLAFICFVLGVIAEIWFRRAVENRGLWGAWKQLKHTHIVFFVWIIEQLKKGEPVRGNHGIVIHGEDLRQAFKQYDPRNNMGWRELLTDYEGRTDE